MNGSFFLLFWTPAQKFFNQQLVAVLSKIVKLPHIFLYLICLKMQNGKSIPIAQFLSAQQVTVKIKYFLQRFVENFGQPDEVNLDEVAALQKACVNIFANCQDMKEYVNKCFNILNNTLTER